MPSKKDFKNPALIFAPQPAEEPEQAAPAKEEPARETAAASGKVPPAGYRFDYGIIETKSRRVQLLMQPTLYTALKEQAGQLGLSFNDYVHRILEAEAFGKDGAEK